MNDLKIPWSEKEGFGRFRSTYCPAHQDAMHYPGQKEKISQRKENLDWLASGRPGGSMFLPVRTPRGVASLVSMLVLGRAVGESEETGMDVVRVASGTEDGSRAERPRGGFRELSRGSRTYVVSPIVTLGCALGTDRGVGWSMLLRTVPRLTMMGVDEGASDFFPDSLLMRTARSPGGLVKGRALGTREVARPTLYPLLLSVSSQLSWTPAGGESRRMGLLAVPPGKSETVEMMDFACRLLSTSLSGSFFTFSMVGCFFDSLDHPSRPQGQTRRLVRGESFVEGI